MAITAYNSLTRRKEPLAPLRAGHVGMYLCGVTPYSDCHIGHLLGPVVFDAIARWLISRAFTVRLVNNITDIDDKIIERSARDGVPWQDIANRYSAQYLELQRRLHVATVTDHPRCTAYIPQMVAYIADLVARDRAYVGTDGVYYDIAKQPSYGKLSGRRAEDMLSGARIERDAHLRNPGDFALWKLAEPGEPSWPSPWGAGRPGWHIECSVMSNETLGPSFDIHGGGDDLKFPHHENEIAQGEAHGGEYARLWMHNGMVQYHGAKVSKSDKRMAERAFADRFKAVSLVDTHGAATIRYVMLNGHYRRPTEFSEEAITAARTALAKLHRQLGAAMEEPAALAGPPDLAAILTAPLDATLEAHRLGFVQAMDDDFNTGEAIAHLFGMLSASRALGDEPHTRACRIVRDLGRVIGLFQPGDARDTGAQAAAIAPRLEACMAMVIELRQRARAAKQFAASDAIRAALNEAGVVVKDGKDGAAWSCAADQDAATRRVERLLAEAATTAQGGGDAATAERIRGLLSAAPR